MGRDVANRSPSQSTFIATIYMRRLIGFAAFTLLTSAANAQDTTVVIVRHLPAQQDTGVVVRHLAPAPAPAPAAVRAPVRAPAQSQRMAPPYGAPRYALRSTTLVAKDPYVGTMLSFVFPGGGQYYAGATAKGLALTLIGIGAPIIGFANVNRDHGYNNIVPLSSGVSGGCIAYAGGPSMYGYGGGYCPDHHRYDWTPAAVGLGVGITAWLYGVATAGTDVRHWNQAHGVRFVTAPGRAGFAVALP
jgi:hypothetical protein